jgi:hypothetical protein
MPNSAPLEEQTNTVSATFATPEDALAAVDRLRALGVTNIRDAAEPSGLTVTMNAGSFEQEARTIVVEHRGRLRGLPG